MAAQWTVPGVNHFVIGTDRDTMGISDWKIFLVDLDTGAVTDETENITIDEVVHQIANPVQVAVTSPVSAGSKVIEVSDASNITAGMKIEIADDTNNEFREVRKVTGNKVVFYRPLENSYTTDISDSEEPAKYADVTQSGRTGDYRVIVDSNGLTGSIVAGGEYQFQVKADSVGIDITSEMIHAIDYDFDNLKEDVDYIKNGIDSLLGSSGARKAKIYI